VGTGASELLALTPNGALKWRYAVGDWIESSPAIGPDGAIYIGSADNTLYAINPDGTLRWKYLTGGDIASAPTLAADGTVYAGSRDGILYALNPDGTLKWGFTTNALIDSSASLARDGTICFGSSDGHVYALRPDGTEKWRYPAPGAPALLAVYSSPAVRDDGSVVIGTSNNKVICLNADGTLRWETAVGDWVDSSPLVTADGTIYVGCQDKVLYCLNGTQGPIATDWGQYRRDPMRSAWQPIGVAANNTGRISNMSVRASFSAGQTISVGTWLNGTGARTLLARAVGPTLEGFGVAGFMPDPTFAIYNQGAFVSENDNWEQAPNLAALNTATAANTGFALGAGKADAAVLQSFSAGGYTLEVTGKNGSSGVCLVELYDTGGASTARISNISARTLVGTGEKVLVPGFYLSGGSRTLLIRGIGPSLAPFFTPDYLLANPLLAVPRLRIYSGTRLIAETLAWSAVSNANQIKTLSASVFAFSLLDNSLDAAILVTLPEGGPYTATLDGVGDTTGLGMVEVYELP
jgi:outer membrane protein assembly factor BamB